MFRKSSASHQLDLFTSPNNLLQGKSLNSYENENSWHNQFRVRISNKIDEDIFKPLYHSVNGSPNAPIRILIAMMILKESRGMSDAEIFENARYNMLIRSAIGLMNMEDSVPTESTYYLFRKKILEYEQKHNENLLDKVFGTLTKNQCAEFEVSGKRIRMDSKLLGSNIAWLSRYELIHKTLEIFYKEIKSSTKLDNNTKEVLDNMLSLEGNKVVYTQSSEEVKNRLELLGELIYKLLSLFELKTTSYRNLRVVFDQQYDIDVKSDSVSSKPNKKINAKSIQSPYDTDSHYRNKDGNKKKGYSINITETCEGDNSIDLITSVIVDKASASDNSFFEASIKDTEKIIQSKVSTIHADGAYHSQSNQIYCEGNGITLHLHAIQGRKGRYNLNWDKNNKLLIYDNKDSKQVDYKMFRNRKGRTRWRIKIKKGYRYFSIIDVKNSLLRQKIEQTPIEVLQKRNNVEASIFQLCYHYPNAKSRYRGEIKHQMWATIRCIWVNFVRILNYPSKLKKLILNFLKNTVIIANKTFSRLFCRLLRLFVKKELRQINYRQLA